MDISVVVPVYGSPSSLEELTSRIAKVTDSINRSHEIILVNDGCPRGSWQVVCQLAQTMDGVIGINLSRNFGQHYAITCGLHYSRGHNVVVMDCDLQDLPEEIPKLLAKMNEGYDLVFGQRKFRQDGFWKRISSKFFHKVFSYMTDTESDASVANFGVYSRKVIDAYLTLSERNRAFPLHVRWLGFNKGEVEVQHSGRYEGTSSYNLTKLMKFAFDTIISFSDKPLKLFLKFGFLISTVSIFFAAYFFIMRITYRISVEGWTSLIVSVWFLGGVIIMMLGIVGVYVAKSFDEAKARPTFVVDEIVGR